MSIVRAAGVRHVWPAKQALNSFVRLSGEQLDPEDIYHLEGLIKKLKMIEHRQATLQEYVDADVKKVSG